MKIEDPRAPLSSSVAPTSADPHRSEKAGRVAAGSDGVSLSKDLHLASEAIRAAAVTADVRQDQVARARALLESGELGSDLDRLADRIIDSLIESHDPAP